MVLALVLVLGKMRSFWCKGGGRVGGGGVGGMS